MLGLGINLGLGARAAGGAVTPFTSIAANGRQATVASPTDLSLTPFPVQRAGFDATGTAATISDTLRLTKHIRLPFPDVATLTDDQVAISDYVYTDDVLPGAINNSTKDSPKPIANWQMVERLTVGNSVYWEIAAFHRDARNGTQVACVRVRANDGTTQTAWQTVSTPSISAHAEDANPIEVYSGTLDITALATGLEWLEAEVFPHFGVAAAVLRSEDVFASAGYLAHRFGRRYYLKDVTKASSPPYAYVSSTGDDATGVISTTVATAEASPFLTVQGVLTAARTQLGTSNGDFDNLHIRIVDGVSFGSIPFNTYWQDIGAVIIERAPGTARASAVVTIAATLRLRWSNKSSALTEGSLIFRDCSVTLGGAFTFQGESANQLYVQFHNCNINFGSFTTNMRSNSHLGFYGCDFSNYAQNISTATGLYVRILRGCSGDLGDFAYTVWNMCGNSFERPGLGAHLDRNIDGRIIYNNSFLRHGVLNPAINIVADAAGDTIGTFAVVQNVIERTGTGNTQSLRLSGDSDAGNVFGAVVQHNTIAGDEGLGRLNVFYDDTAATARFHDLISFVGNIGPEFNTKSDKFMEDGTRQGNWGFSFGAGCEGNFSAGAVPDNFAQDYGGVGSVIAGGDPLFTSNQAVDATGPVAGAGGGDYTLQAGSPARDLVTRRVLSFDITGAARPASGTIDAGAYA